MAKVIMMIFLAHMARPQCLEQIWVLCEGDSPVGVVLLTSSDVPVLVRPSLVCTVSLSVSNCLSSQPQAYLQQAQDLVILESIILQTLGKFGGKSRFHHFPPESRVVYNDANLLFRPQQPPAANTSSEKCFCCVIKLCCWTVVLMMMVFVRVCMMLSHWRWCSWPQLKTKLRCYLHMSASLEEKTGFKSCLL